MTITLHAWMFPAFITVLGLPIAHAVCKAMGDFQGNFPGLIFAMCVPAWGITSIVSWITWGLS